MFSISIQKYGPLLRTTDERSSADFHSGRTSDGNRCRTDLRRDGSGWLLPLDFGVVPCSKCHSRDFIGQYRKRPVYHLNRSLGGRRLVRLPGMAASNVCERVLSTHCCRLKRQNGSAKADECVLS